jgi:hypothetical protein
MAESVETMERLHDAAIVLANKAQEANTASNALQYAYAAAALANAARGEPAGSSYSLGH